MFFSMRISRPHGISCCAAEQPGPTRTGSRAQDPGAPTTHTDLMRARSENHCFLKVYIAPAGCNISTRISTLFVTSAFAEGCDRARDRGFNDMPSLFRRLCKDICLDICPGICPAYAPAYARHMPGICLAYAWHMPLAYAHGICLQHMPPAYARHMPGICPAYA